MCAYLSGKHQIFSESPASLGRAPSGESRLWSLQYGLLLMSEWRETNCVPKSTQMSERVCGILPVRHLSAPHSHIHALSALVQEPD